MTSKRSLFPDRDLCEKTWNTFELGQRGAGCFRYTVLFKLKICRKKLKLKEGRNYETCRVAD